MKKMLNVGLILLNNGAVKAKYGFKRTLPSIRSISKKQKQFARTQVSKMLPKWRQAKFASEFAEEFSDQCLRVGLGPDGLEKLRAEKQPHCLLYLPQIGGDPYLRVVNQDEWTEQMGMDVIEIGDGKEKTLINHTTPKQSRSKIDSFPTSYNQSGNISPFSKEQMKLIQNATNVRTSLSRLINPAVGQNTKYRHVILSGAAGLGKTHFVQSFFKINNLPYARITGAISLFSLGVKLAGIMVNRKPNETLYIHIDDADVAFRSEEGCNLLKQMLFDDNAFIYERNIGPLIQGFQQEVRAAVEGFRTERSLGFRIPLDNVVFIITSNIPLPSDREVTSHFGKNGHSGILVHRNAIRSRCKYRYLDFNQDQRWGWIASAFLEDGKMPNDDNFIIKCVLDFMWKNRLEMQEYNVRTAELMLQKVDEYPGAYYEEWKNEFLWHLS